MSDIRYEPLGQRPYIAAVRAADAAVSATGRVQLAIYAPGTVCYCAADHWQQAASAASNFLAWLDDSTGWALLGPECLRSRYPAVDLRPWQHGLAQHHFLRGPGLAADWRHQTRRDYWRLVPVMALILQVEPGLGILRGYLDRATRRDKREFTPAEKRELLRIIRQRGGPARARDADPASWDQELKSHRQVLRRRRDLAFRLARLETLALGRADQDQVRSLAAANTRWRGEQLGSLTEKQERLVAALEAVHFTARAQAAGRVAWDLAGEFALELPQRSRWRSAD